MNRFTETEKLHEWHCACCEAYFWTEVNGKMVSTCPYGCNRYDKGEEVVVLNEVIEL